MTPEDRAVISAARSLIADPAHWCQGTYARDNRGYPINPIDPDACSWCALGALARAAVDVGASPGTGAGAVDILYRVSDSASTVVGVNDRDGHEAVIALFDRALAADLPQPARVP
jgi:hypothetical protein